MALLRMAVGTFFVDARRRRTAAAGLAKVAWLRLGQAARAAAGVGLAFALLALGGCATLPGEVARTPSSAIADVGATPLARLAAASTPPERLHLSGLRLLPDAAQAFELRLALVRKAQVSLDLQYYLVARDDSGGQLLSELEHAAQRGVRVRLLVDDLHAAASEAAVQRLSALPGTEVRLFNPLPSRIGTAWTTRLLLSLHEFGRVNRRMHNKLLVADNTFAVTGGRNIADEYFMRGRSSNFIDLDLLASGPIVRELSDLFDRFWNSEPSVPIEALGAAEAARFAETPGKPLESRADDGVLREFEDGRVELRFAPVQLFADTPAKAAEPVGIALPPTAMDSTLHLFRAEQKEIAVVSPYFVPGQRGMAEIRAAAERGLRLAVTTNSLASTDEPLAHLGYARYRSQMLGLGVRITEVSPTGASRLGLRAGLSASVGRLHAKVALVDRRWVLIGSLNMDARSSRTNTELALVIDSPELAEEMSVRLHAHWRDDHYQLRRVPAGGRLDAPHKAEGGGVRWQVEWVSAGTGSPSVHRSEPRVGPFARLRLGLISMVVPEEWL